MALTGDEQEPEVTALDETNPSHSIQRYRGGPPLELAACPVDDSLAINQHMYKFVVTEVAPHSKLCMTLNAAATFLQVFHYRDISYENTAAQCRHGAAAASRASSRFITDVKPLAPR